MAKRKKGVRKGKDPQQSWAPPEKHAAGLYGSHRTEHMEDARAARLAALRSARSGHCDVRLEVECVRGTPSCTVRHITGYERCN